MYSVSETIEFELFLVTASPSIWIVGDILYWPPEGSSINRSILVPPGPDWIPYKCKVLKSNIETFKEALEFEKMYSKHRNSTSFHEFQEQQKAKRQHPVNCDPSQLDLIDVNDMIKKINGNAGVIELAAGLSSHTNNYHESCVTAGPKMRTVTKPVSKVTSPSVKPKKENVNNNAQAAKKSGKRPLPFQNNYLKSGISKAKNRVVSNAEKPKRPRYDNFLKSGKRCGGVQSKGKSKDSVPSATITKDEYLKQNGKTTEQDLADENCVSPPKTLGRASTPVETYDPNHDFLNISRNSAYQSFGGNEISITNESYHENVEKFEGKNLKKVHVLGDISVRPATKTSSQAGMSFEERILKELFDLKKNQESFESRIEKRIETFFNEQAKAQLRMQGNNQSNMQATGQLRMQGNFQSRMLGNGQSRMQDNDQSRMQYQSRQNRQRQPAFSEQYVDDFDDFEEMDEHFPVNIKSNVEELEFSIRKDLEFKFRLLSRLNDLGGCKYIKCIRLKMKYLFTDPVLENYSWRGTATKRAFKDLKALNNLILRSVRDRCPNTARDEYKDYMVQWLKHARSRQRQVTYTYPAQRNLNRDGSSDEDDESIN